MATSAPAPTLYAKLVAWVEAGPTSNDCRTAPAPPCTNGEIGSPPSAGTRSRSAASYSSTELRPTDTPADQRSADLEIGWEYATLPTSAIPRAQTERGLGAVDAEPPFRRLVPSGPETRLPNFM